jgi:hypothetical protein
MAGGLDDLLGWHPPFPGALFPEQNEFFTFHFPWQFLSYRALKTRINQRNKSTAARCL